MVELVNLIIPQSTSKPDAKRPGITAPSLSTPEPAPRPNAAGRPKCPTSTAPTGDYSPKKLLIRTFVRRRQ